LFILSVVADKPRSTSLILFEEVLQSAACAIVFAFGGVRRMQAPTTFDAIYVMKNVEIAAYWLTTLGTRAVDV
jgi:hypothetical protein